MNTIITQESVTVRECTISDYDAIERIINKHNQMWGIDITKGIRQSHLAWVQLALTNLSHGTKIIGVFFEGIICSVSLIKFWTDLPHWSQQFSYSDTNINFFNKTSLETMVIKCLEHSIFIAEKSNRFTFYIIVRHSEIWDRQELQILENFDYTVHKLEMIKPYTYSNYGIIKNILGPLSGINPKPIIALQATKINMNQILFSKADGEVKVIKYDRL
ncbi:MAG: hypothetical protein EBV10_02660 [Synechococcaceae bacterium WB6_1A_059]|nr:hypothetical protein [Synechococcaceae bacterium WB6_1A_059]